MAVRLFTCSACEHQMRLAGTRCGYCGKLKLFWQQPAVIILVIILGILAVPAMLAAVSL